MNQELHKQLVDACERFVMFNNYNQAIQNIANKRNNYQAEFEKTKKKGFRATPGVLIIIFSMPAPILSSPKLIL